MENLQPVNRKPGSDAQKPLRLLGLKVGVGERHLMDRVGLSLGHAHSKPCIGQPCDGDRRSDVARVSAQETGLKPCSTQYVGLNVPPWSWDLCVQRRSTP